MRTLSGQSSAFPDIVLSTTPYSSAESGNLVTGASSTRGVNVNNVSYRVPKKGYDGQVAIHPNIIFPPGVGNTRSGIVQHALREAYFRTTGKLPYISAHVRSGGQDGYPRGIIVGGVTH